MLVAGMFSVIAACVVYVLREKVKRIFSVLDSDEEERYQ
jgi:hypothetical protein